MIVVWNGNARPGESVAISPTGDGVQFGAGIFTTIRVRGGRAELLPLHEARLRRDAAALGLAPREEARAISERVAACVAANGIVDGGVKVMWLADGDARTAEWIGPRSHAYGPEQAARGFRLQTIACEVRERRTLARHKTTNYLEHLRAKRAALAAGFDEALWIDANDEALEGATTNLFIVSGGELITPPVERGLLPGVVRERILDARDFPPVRAERVTRAALLAADEVFVTNALAGVMPVRAVDGRAYALEKNPVTRLVAGIFDRMSRT